MTLVIDVLNRGFAINCAGGCYCYMRSQIEKLVLSQETVRNLTQQESGYVAPGRAMTRGPICDPFTDHCHTNECH